MHIQDHIVSNIPIFKIGDPLSKVIPFFQDNTYSHVAIIENGNYLGVLDENDLEQFEEDKNIEHHRYDLGTFFVRKDTNWLDVLETFARYKANLVPVLDEEGRMEGYYDLTDIVNVFIDTPFFTEPGGIIVLAKGIMDYSFSEIAQIVESNNTQLIGGFITDSKNDVIQITIKVASANLNEIIQTFRRYNYNILFGNNDDQFLEDLKERSNYLDKYLNV
jgi:CBS domain containing-hemolysin-like protein